MRRGLQAEIFDDGKEPPKPKMSEAQRKKLRDEYLGLGGSPNQVHLEQP